MAKGRFIFLIDNVEISRHGTFSAAAKAAEKRMRNINHRHTIQDGQPTGEDGEMVPIVWMLIGREWKIARHHKIRLHPGSK